MIDLSGLQGQILQLVASLAALVIMGLFTAGANALRRKWGLDLSSAQQQQFDNALHKALSWAVTQSESTIRAKGWDHLDTKNTVIAMALPYALSKFPDALRAVGIAGTDEQSLRMALSRAWPAAAAVLEASPATPTVAAPVPVQDGGNIPDPRQAGLGLGLARGFLACLVIGLAFSLSACGVKPAELAPRTPSAVLYETETALDVGINAATAYARLPRCSDTRSTPVCADQVTVNKIVAYANAAVAGTGVARDALRVYNAVLLPSLSDTEKVQATVAAAAKAVADLQTTLKLLGAQ